MRGEYVYFLSLRYSNSLRIQNQSLLLTGINSMLSINQLYLQLTVAIVRFWWKKKGFNCCSKLVSVHKVSGLTYLFTLLIYRDKEIKIMKLLFHHQFHYHKLFHYQVGIITCVLFWGFAHHDCAETLFPLPVISYCSKV